MVAGSHPETLGQWPQDPLYNIETAPMDMGFSQHALFIVRGPGFQFFSTSLLLSYINLSKIPLYFVFN